MKKRLMLLYTVICLCTMITLSCNKGYDPIILSGSWQIDTARVDIAILYDKSVYDLHPNAVNVITSNKNYFRSKLKELKQIDFNLQNQVSFSYLDGRNPLMGTYTQQDMYFTIKNTSFPKGLNGASDNQRLELYYDTEYMLSLLFEILTPQDDSPEVFKTLIKGFEGLGSYKK